MEKKYISENRYKKRVGKKRRNLSAIRKSDNASSKVKKTDVKKKNKPRIKASIRRERLINRINIFVCIILILLIAIILRAILKEEGEPFIPIFFGTEENEQILKVGVITDEDLLNTNTNNVVLREMKTYSDYMLLTINEDYSLEYDIIKEVQVINDKEYILKILKSKEYDANSIKKVLLDYANDAKSIYNKNLEDISSIVVKDEITLQIILKNSNPYFLYSLEIPIASTNKKSYLKNEESNSACIVFERTRYASKQAPKRIVIKRYKDMYAAVEAYKKQEINLLITNQKNVQNILGKYEYNLKTYRNGENIFLFLNNNSSWLKNKEIRQVLAYSIDRDNIVKEVMQSTASIIDLPYIYDNVKYKYDIYASENLLLSNGYKKTNGVYTKSGKQVTLSLIVNKYDEEKVQIANVIKNNLSAVGIKLNIDQLTSTELAKRIAKADYDIVLSTVNLNNNPDIRFLLESIYGNDELIDVINNKSESIDYISNSLSNNISCIGILSKTNYVVFSKDIQGLGDISYLNLFKQLINK